MALFDVLAGGGEDLRHRSCLERRSRLGTRDVNPPLSITPTTDDPEEAMDSYHRYAPAGVEGLVAKGASQPYLDATRGWCKFRHRHSTEALVGAVDGRLRMVGATSVLATAGAAEVGRRLQVAADEHPWTAELPGQLLGSLPGQRGDVGVERTAPETVVEMEVDTAFDRGRWRHPVRYRRIGLDVDPPSITNDHIRRL